MGPPPAPAAPPRTADVAALVKRDAAVAERTEAPAAEKKGAAIADKKGAAVADKKDDADLTTHVKRDWATIKRGFANAGADFRSAIDEFRRNVNGGK